MGTPQVPRMTAENALGTLNSDKEGEEQASLPTLLFLFHPDEDRIQFGGNLFLSLAVQFVSTLECIPAGSRSLPMSLVAIPFRMDWIAWSCATTMSWSLPPEHVLKAGKMFFVATSRA